MSPVFYQMYSEKVARLLHEEEVRQNAEAERRRKEEENTKYHSTTYNESLNTTGKPNKSRTIDEEKLNVSTDSPKKRVAHLRKPRNMLSTQETSSLDISTHRTIDRNDRTIEDVELILPSLYKKTKTNHFIRRP